MLSQDFEPPDEELTVGSISAFLFRPKQFSNESRKRGVIVFPDTNGVRSLDVQRISRFISELGFITLLPDLFRNYPWGALNDKSELSEWRALHPRERVMEDVQGCISILRNFGASKVGVVGFCWGGELALYCSTIEGLVDTAVGFYPTWMHPQDGARVSMPSLFIFGQQDELLPTRQVEAFANAARQTSVVCSIRMYDGCAHGFAHNFQPIDEAHKSNETSKSFQQSQSFSDDDSTIDDAGNNVIYSPGETVRMELAAWLQIYLDYEPSIEPVQPNEWWPEGQGRQFHNKSLQMWEELRLRWRVPTVQRPPAPPPVDYDLIVDGLSTRVRTFVLPSRMKLSDIIEMFLDVWELDNENGF